MKLFEKLVRTRKNKPIKLLATALAAVIVFVTVYSLILPAITIEEDQAVAEAGFALASAEALDDVNAEGAYINEETDAGDEADTVQASEQTVNEDAYINKEASDSDVVENGTADSSKTDNAETEDKSDNATVSENKAADGTDKTVAADKNEDTSVNSEDADVETGTSDISMPAVTFEEETNKDNRLTGVSNIKVTVEAEEGTFPEGTTLKIKEVTSDRAVTAAVKAAVADSEEPLGKVQNIQAVDITFFNKEGERIEPLKDIKVTIQSDMIREVEEPVLVHVPENGQAEIIDQMSEERLEDLEIKLAEDEVAFEAGEFSVYAVVGTETINTTYLTADGEKYTITVTYGPEAEIPEGSTLEVSELVNDNKDYTGYVERATKALAEDNETPFVNSARLFDISIVADGKKVEPKAPVEVKIEYANPESLNETSEVGAVHFKESTFKTETEVLDIDVQGEEGKVDGVTFTTDSFSIYVVVIIDKEAGTFVVEDENYKITITYTKEANIPIGTEMTVREIEYASKEYWDLWNQTIEKLNEGIETGNELEADPRKGLTDAQFFDISLIYEGKEIEPDIPLRVKIEYQKGILLPGKEEPGVIHFGKTDAEIIQNVKTEGEGAATSFEYLQSGFSPVGTYSTGEYVDPDISLLSLPGSLNASLKAAGDSEVGAMVASKVLDPNDDGTYTLKLKVTGQAQSGTSSSITKSNVVIVVDVSGSMDESAGRYQYTLSAQEAYNSSNYTESYDGRSYNYSPNGTSFYYNGAGNDATRVYATYDGTNYRWATYGNNGWNNYTGSVYVSGTRLEAMKSALYTLVDALLANNKDETITDADGNVITLSDTIEITLVQFANKNSNYNGNTYNDTRTLIRNATKAGSINQSTTLKGRINGLTASGGTNWEAALQLALTEANRYKNASTTSHAGTEADPIQAMANETTSVIFFTDGLPTFYVNGNNDGGNGAENQNNKNNVTTSWNNARDDARALVTNGFTVYNIFAFGGTSTQFTSDSGANGSLLTPSDYLKAMTNYEYNVSNNYGAIEQYRNNNTTTYTSDYFFDASNTTKLQQAFEKIINSLNNLVAFGGVDVHDGVSFGATNSTLLLNDGTIDPTSFTYTVSTGTTVDYTVRVNSSGQPVFTFGTGSDAQSYIGTSTTVQVPDPTDPNNKKVTCPVYSVTVGEGDDAVNYVMSPAKLYSKTEEGVTRQGIEWDLTGVGTLGNGQSYELSFIVWPNQDAYDLIAELNNGHITLAQAAAMDEYKDIVPYISGNKETGYSLSTNWEQYVDYYKVEAETDEKNNTTYKYTVQDPVQLNPGSATLASTKMFMNKVWNDSLDTSQIEKILTDNPKYQVALRIWKADTEAALSSLIANEKATYGEDESIPYDQRVVLGWQEGTDEGIFAWTKDYTIAPGVMVKDGDTAAVNIGLTLTSHNGYDLAKYNGDYYYILEKGHYYTVTEENIDDHFLLEEHVYHPMVVNGVVSDVSFNGVLADDPYGAIDVESVEPMTSVNATNTLRGGININKVVKDPDGTILDTDKVFEATITMATPKDSAGNLDFSNLDTYKDKDGNLVDSSVAWYAYYDGERRIYDGELIEAGILEYVGEDTSGYTYGSGLNHPADKYYDYGSGWFMLDFDNTTGALNGRIALSTKYTIRFVNMATGIEYALPSETVTHGMTPTISYYHVYVEDEETITSSDPEGEAHKVNGNQENNILVTNTTETSEIKILKVDIANESKTLDGVTFKLYADSALTKQITIDSLGAGLGNPIYDEEDETEIIGYDGILTTANGGKINVGTLIDGTYYLVETSTKDGYNLLSEAVEIKIENGDATVKQKDYKGGQAIGPNEDDYLTVANSTGVSLPSTGGSGTLIYTLSGIALVVCAALMYGFRMRRRGKEVNS